ncbi:unnamed protein product [Pylaiella littoralis]
MLLPPPPPPPPPPLVQNSAAASSYPVTAQQPPQQHPLAKPIAERIASIGPQELEAMRRLPDAQTQYPFIFDGHPGFGPFRDTLASLVMPRLAGGGGGGGGSTGT